MTIREMRASLGNTRGEFAARYNIPFRTVQNWEAGVRNPPEYIMDLLESRVHIQATREPCIGSLALDAAAVTVFYG